MGSVVNAPKTCMIASIEGKVDNGSFFTALRVERDGILSSKVAINIPWMESPVNER